MSTDLLTNYYTTKKKEIEKRIDLQCSEWKKNEFFHQKLTEAMSYSLQAGGKRLRPLMAHMCFDYVVRPLLSPKNSSEKENLDPIIKEYQSIVADFALCLEMIHTYSLIHDDLPAIDNDDLRRGKPTCHKVYGEDVAILAGNALQSEAFYLLARCAVSEKIDKNDLCHTIKKLSSACGPNGMIGGQTRDILKNEDRSPSKKLPSLEENLKALRLTHSQKTGALIKVSFLGTLYLFQSKIGEKSLLAPLKQFVQLLGLAFQITDDILDETSSTEVLGKQIKSDIKNTKRTFTSLLGVKKSQDYLQNIEKEAFAAIEKIEQTLKNKSFSEKNNDRHWTKTANILRELCYFVTRRDH